MQPARAKCKPGLSASATAKAVSLGSYHASHAALAYHLVAQPGPGPGGGPLPAAVRTVPCTRHCQCIKDTIQVTLALTL